MDKRLVVAVTPAGRRRYMRLLIPQVLSCPDIDRYDIWLNTTDPDDLRFLELVSRHPKVRLIHLPDGKVNGSRSINPFYKFTSDPGTTYIKFDDDIVWIDNKSISKMIEYRNENENFAFITPMVVNNAVCTALLQARGKLNELKRAKPYCLDNTGWRDPHFAEQLHRHFLKEITGTGVGAFVSEDTLFAMSRFSINCVAWRGELFAEFSGVVVGEDEEEISINIPARANLPNLLFGNAVVAHFAFYTQREHLDRTDLLDLYRAELRKKDWIDEDALGLVEESFAEAESRSGQGSRKGFGKLLDVQFYSPRIRFSVRKKKIRELLRM